MIEASQELFGIEWRFPLAELNDCDVALRRVLLEPLSGLRDDLSVRYGLHI